MSWRIFMWGGSGFSTIDNKVVLIPEQFLALYHKKVINKIIFPREVYFESQKGALTAFKTAHINMEDVIVANRLSEHVF